MNKAIALTGLLLLLPLGACDEQLPEDQAKAHVVAAIEGLQQLMLAGDVEATLRDVPPELFPKGEKFWQGAMDNADASRTAVIAFAEGMQFLPPAKIYQVEDRSLCIVRRASSVQGTPVRGYFVGVSDDGGQSWAFIDGSDAMLEWWRGRYPELIAPMEPEVQMVNGWVIEGTLIQRDRVNQDK